MNIYKINNIVDLFYNLIIINIMSIISNIKIPLKSTHHIKSHPTIPNFRGEMFAN